jgi:hypothetical protein
MLKGEADTGGELVPSDDLQFVANHLDEDD